MAKTYITYLEKKKTPNADTTKMANIRKTGATRAVVGHRADLNLLVISQITDMQAKTSFSVHIISTK